VGTTFFVQLIAKPKVRPPDTRSSGTCIRCSALDRGASAGVEWKTT
jgi:hypothetical protein